MKRSEVNRLIDEAVAFLEETKFKLPPFAFWTPADWSTRGHEYDEIRDNMLGWDITDFGLGDFYDNGLLLFTLRNGNTKIPKYVKPYAEKLMLVREKQKTPMHFHWYKMEDIINRGGGNLLIQLYNATEDEQLADTPVNVMVDGRWSNIQAGTTLRLVPGESITLSQRVYHKFWAEEGTGMVMAGEVSMTNDDTCDNRFLENVGRFPAIEEDEPARYVLGNEYPAAMD